MIDSGDLGTTAWGCISAPPTLGQVISFARSLNFPIQKMVKSGIEDEIVPKDPPALKIMVDL